MWYKLAFEKLAGLKEDLLRILGEDSQRLAMVRKICPNPKFQTAIAYFLMQNVRENQLSHYVEKLVQLEHLKKIRSLFVSKSGVHLNDKIFTDWLAFTESVDALIPAPALKDLHQEKYQPSADTTIGHGKNIEIHKAKNVVDACSLGKGMSWCISQPGNTMYQSYRDMQQSTFYFVVDNNKKSSDPLHRVVIDVTANGPLLTDSNNTTGRISEFGEDASAYFDYLHRNGVDTSILVNDPLTPEEEAEIEELDNKPSSMNPEERFGWFKDLPLDYKSKFIGRGFKLSFPEFKYLLDSNLSELAIQYLNAGHALSSEEFALIANNNQYRKTYIRARKQALEQAHEEITELDNQIPELQQCIESICDKAKINYHLGTLPFAFLPLTLRNNVEFAKKAYEDGKANFYDLPQILREDRSFVQKAYEQGSAMVYDIPDERNKNDELAKKDFQEHKIEFNQLPKTLRENIEFAKKAFEEGRANFGDLPYTLQEEYGI